MPWIDTNDEESYLNDDPRGWANVYLQTVGRWAWEAHIDDGRMELTMDGWWGRNCGTRDQAKQEAERYLTTG